MSKFLTLTKELHEKVNRNLQANFDERLERNSQRTQSTKVVNENIKENDHDELRSPFRNDKDFKEELTNYPIDFKKIDKIRMIAFALREEVYFDFDGSQKLGIEQLEYEGAISGSIYNLRSF